MSQENSEIVSRINKTAPSIRILNSDNNSAFGMCITDGEKLLRVEIRQSEVDDFSEAKNIMSLHLQVNKDKQNSRKTFIKKWILQFLFIMEFI